MVGRMNANATWSVTAALWWPPTSWLSAKAPRLTSTTSEPVTLPSFRSQATPDKLALCRGQSIIHLT